MLRTINLGTKQTRCFGETDDAGSSARPVVIVQCVTNSASACSRSETFSGLTHPAIARYCETVEQLGVRYDIFEAPQLVDTERLPDRLSPGALIDQLREIVPALMELHGVGLVHGNIGPSTMRRSICGASVLTETEYARFGEDTFKDVRALGLYCARVLGTEPKIPVDVLLRQGDKWENRRLLKIIHGTLGTKAYTPVETMAHIHSILSGDEDTVDIGSTLKVRRETVRASMIAFYASTTLAALMTYYPA